MVWWCALGLYGLMVCLGALQGKCSTLNGMKLWCIECFAV